MYLYHNRADSSWTVHTPAKINLFFEVYAKRSDGFHDVSSVALPIRLFDTLHFEPIREERIDFECVGGASDVPTGPENIVVRALRLYRKRITKGPGVRVRLFKRIPSQAGLGGGSSDAAAALAVAARLWPPAPSLERLMELAAEIGSDCPIFFHRGPSLARGRGEIIRPVASAAALRFVVVKPAEGLSTAEVYADCMPLHDGRFREPGPLLAALEKGDPGRIGRCLFNRLEEPARKRWPRFETVKREMQRLGCPFVRMSGSGTAFYALCRNAKHAGHVAARLRAGIGKNGHVFSVVGM